MKDPSCILVFVKFPEPGQVKTRLGTVLGDEGTSELYRLFVLDSLDCYSSLNIPVWVVFSPPQQENALKDWLGPAYHYLPQISGNLGQRMEAAFIQAFAQGVDQALLVGTDFPDLPADYLNQGLSALESSGAALGPTKDGGYYCIGFSKPSFRPEVFHDIPWSTNSVFGLTLERLRAEGLNPHLMPIWSDVDRPEDLIPFLNRTGHLDLRSKHYLLAADLADFAVR